MNRFQNLIIEYNKCDHVCACVPFFGFHSRVLYDPRISSVRLYWNLIITNLRLSIKWPLAIVDVAAAALRKARARPRAVAPDLLSGGNFSRVARCLHVASVVRRMRYKICAYLISCRCAQRHYAFNDKPQLNSTPPVEHLNMRARAQQRRSVIGVYFNKSTAHRPSTSQVRVEVPLD